MSFQIFNQLSESQLFPHRTSLKDFEPERVADLACLILCSIRIMLTEHDDEIHHWAMSYCAKTIASSNFNKWRGNATDLYVALHSLLNDEVELRNDDGLFRKRINIQVSLLRQWLHDVSNHSVPETSTDRLFSKLDTMFRISDPAIKSIRRRSMDWPNLSHHEKNELMRQLLIKFRSRYSKAEVIHYLARMAHKHGWEIEEGVVKPRFGLMTALENATAGATCAANFATVVGGFDPQGDWGVYQFRRKKKDKDKASSPIVSRTLP